MSLQIPLDWVSVLPGPGYLCPSHIREVFIHNFFNTFSASFSLSYPFGTIYLELVENISIGPSKEYLQSQSQGSGFQFVNLSHKLQSSLEWRELLHGLTAGVFWP